MPNETRAWTGSTWIQVAPSTGPQSAYSNSTMISDDPGEGGVILASKPDSAVGSMWRWNGTAWSQLLSPLPPSQPYTGLGPAASDPVRQRVVLFLVYQTPATTWEWNGQQWQQRATTGPLRPLSGATAMAWHEPSQRVVLVGGLTGNQTWEWDGSTWQQRFPPSAPSGSGIMAGDSARGVAVLFGGAIGNETWEWNGSTWQQRFPPSASPPLQAWSMTYDRARSRIVLFRNQNTWEWDGNVWQMRHSGSHASDLLLAYDPVRRKTVGFTIATWEYGPIAAADAIPFGAPCSGASTTPSIATHNGALPWLGDTLPVDLVGGATNGLAVFALGLSQTTWSGGSLPLALDSVGMLGCSLLVSPDVTLAAQATGGTATLHVAIPVNTSLIGMHVFVQGFPLVAGANPAGVLASAAIDLKIGSR